MKSDFLRNRVDKYMYEISLYLFIYLLIYLFLIVFIYSFTIVVTLEAQIHNFAS